MNFQEKIRLSAEEGCVLIQNKNNILPLKKEDTVSIFGRTQYDFYKSGMGSGGSVHVPYTTNLTEELLKIEKENLIKVNKELTQIYSAWLENNPFNTGGGLWAGEPFSQIEMELTEEIVLDAKSKSNKAIFVIGRNAGEDKDFIKEKGSWYLSEVEEKNLELICKSFDDVIILLNTCGIIDHSFYNDERFSKSIKSIIYVWHGGMESGTAAANIICGKNIPSGKLSQTIAKTIDDYPSTKNFGDSLKIFYQEDIYVGYRYFNTFAKDKILYPFGFGLSYTNFDYSVLEKNYNAINRSFNIKVKVKNTGSDFSGKEVIQTYLEAPQGKLGKASKVLCAFAKTKNLLPGEECLLELNFCLDDFASYDDSGITGNEFSWILEKGEYKIHLGTDSLNTKELIFEEKIILEKDIVLQKLESALAPEENFLRMKASENSDKTILLSWEDVPLSKIDIAKRIEENLPKEIKYTGNINITFDDLKKDKTLIDKFIGQLNQKELATMVRGEGMMSHKVTTGVTSAFGGLSEALHEYKIPVACTADGPSGIRIDTGKEASLMPIGTQLACTWNTDLVEDLYFSEGEELIENKIDTLLGPGMNIQRNPLNGRNFEYFSEDPFLTGKIALAELKGMNKTGACGTAKHFACNNQEKNRNTGNSIVSERALREIYLKAFEICVKEKELKSLMTSYNAINGHWAASNYDLVNTILHKQWGYTGLVMTDWWAKMNHCIKGGEASVKNTAYMVKARNDVYMIVDNDGAEINQYGDNIDDCIKEKELSICELQLCAKDIILYLLDAPVAKRPLRKLKETIYLESSILNEPVNKNIYKEDEAFLPDTNTYFFAPVDGVYNISGKYLKEAEDLSQSVCNIIIDGNPVAALECRSTGGKPTTVNANQVHLKKGYYKVEINHVKAGIEVESIKLSSKVYTPVSMGIIS